MVTLLQGFCTGLLVSTVLAVIPAPRNKTVRALPGGALSSTAATNLVAWPDKRAVDAWASLSEFVKGDHGVVAPGLLTYMTKHGGQSIRGVVSKDGFNAPGPVTKVPDDLLLSSSTRDFTELVGSLQTVDSQAGSVNCASDPHNMLAVALAQEKIKGNRSRFASYLNALPSLKDYQSFFPRFAGAAVLRDFGGSSIIQAVKKQQEIGKLRKGCFAEWKKKIPHLVMSSINWMDVAEAHGRWSTRRLRDTTGNYYLAPHADMLNTASKTELNTRCWKTEDGFQVSVTKPVESLGELLTDYCTNCDNQLLLLLWGIYQEDNPNKLRQGSADCTNMALRNASLQMLDTSKVGLAQMKNESWIAPRCVASLRKSMAQGPLRCSLARLSWEACNTTWGEKGARAALLRRAEDDDLKTSCKLKKAQQEGLWVDQQGAIGAVPDALITLVSSQQTMQTHAAGDIEAC